MTPERAVLLGKAGAINASSRKIEYESPSVDRPNRLTIQCPPRVPSPHFTTALATRKATTIRRMVPFPKPEYASAGSSSPVSTAPATARTDAVRIGSALTTTEKIAPAKSAKRRQAGTVSPSGGVVHQIAATSAA